MMTIINHSFPSSAINYGNIRKKKERKKEKENTLVCVPRVIAASCLSMTLALLVCLISYSRNQNYDSFVVVWLTYGDDGKKGSVIVIPPVI